MWSGPIVVRRSRRSSSAPVTRQHVGADARRMSAPIFTSIRARSWTCGSQAALPMTVSPGVSAAAMQRVLGRHDRRLVHEDVAGAQAAVGRVEDDVARRASTSAPSAREGVEVRVQPPAADDVAAGRRHLGAAEAREQRAGEQERGADALGRLAVDVRVGGRRRRRRARPRCSPRQLDARRRGARAARASPRRRGCAGRCARRPPPSVRTRGGEDRQRAVLVAGGHDRAGQRHAAVDDELLHERARPAAAGAGRRALG